MRILQYALPLLAVICAGGAARAQEVANVLQDQQVNAAVTHEISPNVDYRGWDYLAQRLIERGVAQESVAKLFGDPRMPLRTPVPFKLKPRETKQMYSAFTMEPRLRIARECLAKNAAPFAHAEREYGVSRYVLAALLLVETQCGQIVGSQLVVDRLARVSSVAEPKNIDYNLSEQARLDPLVTREQLAERADYLERTFLPEVAALFEVASRKGIDVFDLKGSVAGAFGIPQFLPSSFLRFAVDGNKDGMINLFQPEDAIYSAAHFLQSFGWNEHATVPEKKQVLWHYNRSDAYGEAVLKVAILLKHSPLPVKGRRVSTPVAAPPQKLAQPQVTAPG